MMINMLWSDSGGAHCESQQWPCAPRRGEHVMLDGARYVVVDVAYWRERVTVGGSDIKVGPPSSMVVTPRVSLERAP